PTPGPETPGDADLRHIVAALPEEIAAALDAFDFRAAMGAIWTLITRAKRDLEEQTPWRLATAERAGDTDAARRLAAGLYAPAESVRLIAWHLAPFTPIGAEKITRQFGASRAGPGADGGARWGGLAPGTRVLLDKPIYPRIMTD